VTIHGTKDVGHAVALALLVAAAFWLPACGGLTKSGPGAVAIMPGVVNRADNKSLRFAMLKYGLDEFCRQMLEQGAALKLADDAPAVGRFYPRRCEAKVIDDDTTKSFLVQFAGSGYAWTNLTLRIGFDAAGVVEYSPDFLLDGSTMYVYFRPKHVASTNFQTAMVESAGANLAMAMAPGGFADKFGTELVSDQLSRGFTVLRDEGGQIDFGLGVIETGKRPFHPYDVRGGDKLVLANERVEVHGGQREFLGPFVVDSDSRALYLTMAIDGVPAIDVFVLPRDAAEPWLGTYIRTAQTTPPAFAPLMADVVPAGGQWRRTLPVSKGTYYVVLDNTPTAGSVAPAGGALDDRAALANCVVQLGDAP
jgi:hypothetical protein